MRRLAPRLGLSLCAARLHNADWRPITLPVRVEDPVQKIAPLTRSARSARKYASRVHHVHSRSRCAIQACCTQSFEVIIRQHMPPSHVLRAHKARLQAWTLDLRIPKPVPSGYMHPMGISRHAGHLRGFIRHNEGNMAATFLQPLPQKALRAPLLEALEGPAFAARAHSSYIRNLSHSPPHLTDSFAMYMQMQELPC